MDKNAPCYCGSTKKYKHCCQKKDLRKAQESQQQTRMINVWQQEALRALQSNHLPQALALYTRVLQAQPDNLDAQHWIAVISFQRGEKESALVRMCSILEKNPSVARFHATHGNMLKDLGRFQEAGVAYQRSLALESNAPDVLNNYGTVLAIQMKHGDALSSYRKAIALSPNYVDAYSNLAVSLEIQGKENEAKATYQKALLLRPDYPYALAGYSRLEREDHTLAVQLIERALRANGKIGLWWMQLARLETSLGNTDKARSAIRNGLAVEDFPELRLFDATLLPCIMGTKEEVIASREEMESKVERLLRDRVKYRENYTEYVSNNFYMAYHGQNDRKLQMLLAELHLQSLPKLAYSAEHCRQPRHQGAPRKVGFISQYARATHSVGASFAGILNAIAADGRFEVTLISGESLTDEQMDAAYPTLNRQRVLLPNKLELAQQVVGNMGLDILVYLDIGMNAETYSLAFARLARVQCVLGGHPVTTGIPTMDYFLSADSIEVPNAQEHYSERLVRMEHGAFYFKRPEIPQFNKSRSELNLPTQGHIYLCPMTLFKLHPDFDWAVDAILSADPDGTVVFVETPGRPKYRELLESRFNRTISSEVRHRVLFIPWISDKADFMRVLEASEVILDPFHFGIGTTAIWTAALGTPFVTLPSEYMRGRVGMFYCKIMGLEDACVANCKDDYVRKAVKFAADHAWRAQVKARIIASNGVFYENDKGIEDVKSFLNTCELPG